MAAWHPLHDLPSDLIGDIFRRLHASDLRSSACVCAEWNQAVALTAERRLRQYRPDIPLGSDAWPCWLRSLATVELLMSRVGPRPANHWQDDYIPLAICAAKVYYGERWVERWAEDFEPGGPQSFHNHVLGDQARSLLVEAGWPREDAELVVHIAGDEQNQVLVSTFQERSIQFAATIHSMLQAYSAAARRDALSGVVAGPRYQLYKGEENSLCSFDPAWEGLERMKVGEEIITSGGCGLRPDPWLFPDADGMRYGQLKSHDPTWQDFDATYTDYELVDADIVCFLSAPADIRGFHSLVQDGVSTDPTDPEGDPDAWSAPFLSTFKLVSVHEPGEWTVDTGVKTLRVRRRLYTVTVTFG